MYQRIESIVVGDAIKIGCSFQVVTRVWKENDTFIVLYKDDEGVHRARYKEGSKVEVW